MDDKKLKAVKTDKKKTENRDENNKQLTQVRKVHQTIRDRERLEKIKRQGSEVANVPVEAAKQEINSHDNEGMQGQEKVKSTLRPISNKLGDITDKSRREDYLHKIKSTKREGLAGDRLFQGDLKVDFDNLTVGDLKAWRELKRTPKMSSDKFIEIQKSNTDRAVLNKHSRKTIIEIKKAYAVNAYEEKVKDFAVANRQLFTEKQMRIIEKENGLFDIKDNKDLYLNREIHSIYMKHINEAGSFKELNFKRMKGAEYKNLVLRKTDVDFKFFRPESKEFEIGCYAGWWLSEKQEGLKNIGLGGGKRSHLLQGGFDTLVGNEIRSSELGQSYNLVKGTVKGGQMAVKTGWEAAKLGYAVGHKSVELTGKGVVKGLEGIDKVSELTGKGITDELNQTWNRRAAERIKNAGFKYVKAENKVSETVNAVRQAPKKLVDRAVYKATTKLNNTKAVQKIKQVKNKVANSKVGKGMSKAGRGLKKAKHAAMAPLRFIGKVVDVVKKKIMMPVVIVIGIIFLIMIALSALTLVGNDSSSSIIFMILDTEEHFKDFQEKYDSFDAAFIAQVDEIINGYAKTTNKKGQQIKYGVNGSLNSEGNQNEDYRKGVELNYYIDGAESEGISSNIEDCLSVMAVIMQQGQSEHHEEAVELLEALYKSSHTYNYLESALYGCASGCETTDYYCNEIKAEEGEGGVRYWSTEMKFSPWTYEDFVKPSGECVVCKKKGVDGEGNPLKYKDYAGCTVTGTCYHDDEEGKLGRSHTGCDNYSAVWDCDHECDNPNCTHDCSGSKLGCAGYYVCKGHDHYGCPDGHKMKTCFGHVDVTMNVNIASLDRLLEMGGVEKEEGGEKDEHVE